MTMNEDQNDASPRARDLLIAAFKLRFPKLKAEDEADALIGILKIAGFEINVVKPRKP
jgi:hypothetical protein